MKRLRIKTTAEDDMVLLIENDVGIMLVFELLSIAQVPKVPAWVIQRLSL